MTKAKIMPDFGPMIDAAFREYADLELRCHRLISNDKEDSPEMAEVEDRMEKLWANLDDVQQRSLRGMASDLSWIRRKGEPPPKGRKAPEEVSAIEIENLRAAKRSKEWHKFLHLLRLCAPTMSVSSLAGEREMAYDAVGLPDYARVFSGFDPTNGVVAMAAPSSSRGMQSGSSS